MEKIEAGDAIAIICYGMGVHWALNAARDFDNQLSILDLRTLNPLDEDAIYEIVGTHGRALVITEEAIENTFAQALAGKIQENCFSSLDAPVGIIGSVNMPAVPLNSILEQTMIPSAEKVSEKIQGILDF